MMDAAFERVPRLGDVRPHGHPVHAAEHRLPAGRPRAGRHAPRREAPAAGARSHGRHALRTRGHRVLHRDHHPDVQRVHRHVGRRDARAPGHPAGPALRGGPVRHVARPPPAGGGRRDRAARRRAGRDRRPRHGKRGRGRAAAARLGVHLVGHLVARRRRAARRPDQRRGCAAQLHQRGWRLRHDPLPQERDGPVDPRVVPARVDRARGSRSTTTTCCSAPARSTASRA